MLGGSRLRSRNSCQVQSRNYHAGRPLASSLNDLIALAQAGDAAARRELITSASHTGRAIKGLSHGLAPDVVVIGGQMTAVWMIIEPVLLNELQGAYLLPGISRPQLRPASVENPPFFGAFRVALCSVLHKRKKLSWSA
jgi:predicted NBD/HSP70 family sugar kinase